MDRYQKYFSGKCPPPSKDWKKVKVQTVKLVPKKAAINVVGDQVYRKRLLNPALGKDNGKTQKPRV